MLESDATALDAPHTAYRIVGSGSRNWARFTAPQSGSFAFLGAYPATLVFTRADGSEAQATRHDTACAGLPAAFVLELDEAEAVNLSWEAGELLIVIEALAPFGEQAWESSCACSALSQPCTRDAECCSGYCDEGTCRLIDASPCGGKAVIGDECQTSVTCCSGLCLDERCVAPVCRSSGPCVSDAECCLFCHDQDHCH